MGHFALVVASLCGLILALGGCGREPHPITAQVRVAPSATRELESLEVTAPPRGEQVVTFAARYTSTKSREPCAKCVIPVPEPVDLKVPLPRDCTFRKAEEESESDVLELDILELSPPISASAVTVKIGYGSGRLDLCWRNREHHAWEYTADPSGLVESYGSQLAFLREALNTVPEDVEPSLGRVSDRAVALLEFKLTEYGHGVFKEFQAPAFHVLLYRIENHVEGDLFDKEGTCRAHLLLLFPEQYDPRDMEQTTARLLWHAELVE
jgi:hypothetical protein